MAPTEPPTVESTGTSRWTTTSNARFGEWLPLASCAQHCTVVVPTANMVPGSWSQTTIGFGSSLSVAVPFAKVTVVPPASVVLTSMFDGPSLSSTGATVSASVRDAEASAA